MTASLDALKTYLEGERCLRVGRFFDAMEQLQRAVQSDPGFALAYYHLAGAAAGCALQDFAREVIEKGYALRERLAEHDRLLLDAQRAWIHGEVSNAESLYNAITTTYPDDIEAWFHLGDMLFHCNPLRGRSAAESRGAFERVLSYEPDHIGALVHLTRVAAIEGHREEALHLSRRVRTFEPGGRSVAGAGSRCRVHHWRRGGDQPSSRRGPPSSCHHGRSDVRGRRDVFREPRGRGAHCPDAPGSGPLRRAARLVPRLSGPSRSLAGALGSRAGGGDGGPGTRLRPRDRDPGALRRPAVPAGAAGRTGGGAEPASFLESVGGASYGARRARGTQRSPPGHQELPAGPARGSGGRFGRGARGAASTRPIGGTGERRARSLRKGLAAALTRAERGALEALAVLGRPSAELWYQATIISPFLSLAYERFLRAELLHEAGRHAEALGWYGSIAERSPFELVYAAPAQLRRAEIFARQGDREAERAAHQEAATRWAKADPELQLLLPT